ncbi:MAG: uracil-DNA glycosylase [Rickettsiales bacterium]|nr:MAG: uracil-DNA glycosylase [Rickettsiales bacterium]
MNTKEIILEAKKLADSSNSIEELYDNIRNFDGCLLKKTATNTVISDGNKYAKIMIIGEAPGANEDVQGIPFCGDSGKLLDKMLSHIGLSREENIYITNSIFWRPPGNRKPTKDEIMICRAFVEKHIYLINPRLIILAGSTAVSSILQIPDPITKVRNDFYSYNNIYIKDGIKTTAIFHPSYLLRQPSQKKLAWFDLLRIKRYIDDNDIT